jgi:hypothetical protein
LSAAADFRGGQEGDAMRIKSPAVFILILVVAALLGALPASAAESRPKFRPAATPLAIPGRYLVVLASDTADTGTLAAERAVADAHHELAGIYGVRVLKQWSHALKGFYIEAAEATARRLAADPRVRSVEQDERVPERFTSATTAPNCEAQGLPTYDRNYVAALPVNTRPNPTSPQAINCADADPGTNGPCVDNWGLDRTDQHSLPRDGFYDFTHTGGPPGVTVHAYVIDLGIVSLHHEFTGRIGNGVNLVTAFGSVEDCSSYHHGSVVASVIGGSTYGIAKGVILHPVKVADFCTNPPQAPYVSTYVDAFNWIVQNWNASMGPAVANLSGANLPSFVGSVAFANGARGLIQHGVTFVQSAGNEADDACTYSVIQRDPTVSVPDAIVAGGITELRTDGPLRNGLWVNDGSDFLYGGDGSGFPYGYCVNRQQGSQGPPDECGSNYGSCVSIFAPSQWIVGAGWDGDPSHYGGFCYLSGTSLAAPHVAGAAALYLQDHPAATPQQVKAALLAGAAANVLQTSGTYSIRPETGSPNLLLQIVP